MKRSFIAMTFAALCALPVAANAQGLGIIGGWAYGSVPNANSSGPGTYTANSGFAIGVGAETGGVVGLGINALYAQRGFTSSVSGYGEKLDYIDVPLYLRVAIPNPAVVPFAFAGPQLSFELNCDDGSGSCPSGNAKTTYAGVAGVGVKFPMLAGFSVQGRYIYGLQDLNYGTVSNQSNYRQRSFMLLLGIGF
jgi:hypothetical protein